MDKVKSFMFIILGGLLALCMYAVFVADRLLTTLSIRPRVGFRKWLHNPKVSVLRQEGAIDHNLQIMAFIRVTLALFVWLLYVFIW